jgi:hypothetical protein
MENKKILLTSGCSFTFEKWNWPTFVSEMMNYELINVGTASSGNGLIGKKVIYHVDRLLKEFDPKDIVVGVMWSGIDRNDFYTEDSREMNNTNNWKENPTKVVDGHYNWEITNFHWTTRKSRLWYEEFHTSVGSMIQTIQNVLMVQWYLERKNVKYFMSTFLDIFHMSGANNIISHPEVRYLYEMIDFTKFLPVSGCHEWVKENHKEFGFNAPDSNGYIGVHPTEFGHVKFAEEVIVPYLKNNLLL